MKRLKNLAILALVLISMAAVLVVSASAATVDSGSCGENATWTLDDNGTLTISGTGNMDSWYYNSPWSGYKTAIKKVVVENGITSIGNYAFYQCANIESVIIPDGITSVGDWAFYYCSSLKSINFPESVTTIGWYTFGYCTSLTNVTVTDSITSVDGYAFSECPITKITIAEGTQSVTEAMKIAAKTVKEIVIPNTVTSIENFAFSGCAVLDQLSIPSGVTYIGQSAFSGCRSITKITIPNGIPAIYYNTFAGCTSLKSITIPGNVQWIAHRAFEGCTALTDVVISDGVTKLNENAFSGCTSLQNISIPDSVTVVDKDVFTSCTSLKYNVYDNAKYLGNTANPYVVLVESVTDDIASCNISSKTNVVYANAFSGCGSLTNVTIPDSVASIGTYAFSNCSSLSTIKFGKGLTNVAAAAFNGCDNLNDVYITDPNAWCGVTFETDYWSSGDSNPMQYANRLHILDAKGQEVSDLVLSTTVKVVPQYAFKGCTTIKTLTIPNNVTSIGNYAFMDCTSLTSVTLPGSIADDTYVGVGYEAFSNCPIKKLTIADGTKYIRSGMIVGKATLEEVVLPQSLTAIEEYAFEECTSLTKIKIPNSVTTIAPSTFSNCTKLSSVTIGSGVTKIGESAFYNCTSLTTLTIPAGVTNIGNYAFGRCTSLQSVTMPDSVTNVSYDAFYSCPITKLIIADGSKKITYSMVTSGKTLLDVVIPDSVKTITDGAFMDCYGLITVYYGGTEADRGKITIEDRNDNLLNAEWKYGEGGEKESAFADVSLTSWQYKAVSYVYAKNLMAGKGTDANGNIKFDPNNFITREEFVQVLYNAENKPSISLASRFPDVKDNAWYKNAVMWAYSMNVANGMGNGNFGVGKNITRQDLAVMLYKYATVKVFNTSKIEGEIFKYADGNKVASYARTAMDWAVTNGILSGKGVKGEPLNTFKLDPAGTATRAECAAMLKNFMESIWVEEKQ